MTDLERNIAALAQKEIDQLGNTAQLMGLMQHYIDLVGTCVLDLYSHIDPAALTADQVAHKTLLESFVALASVDLSKASTDPLEGAKLHSALAMKEKANLIMSRYLRLYAREQSN